MEDLKLYAIYREEDGAWFDHAQRKLVEYVYATKAELDELVEKASWGYAPYENSYVHYGYEEAEIGRLNLNSDHYRDDIEKKANSDFCRDCVMFGNGCDSKGGDLLACSIFDISRRDHDRSERRIK